MRWPSVSRFPLISIHLYFHPQSSSSFVVASLIFALPLRFASIWIHSVRVSPAFGPHTIAGASCVLGYWTAGRLRLAVSVIQCALVSTPPGAPLGLFCWLDAYCFRCFAWYIRYSESHHLSLERHYDRLRYPPLIALREIRLRDFSALSQGFYKLFSSMETRAPSHNSCLRSKIKI